MTMETFVKSPISWDSLWIEVAFTIAKKSKDKHTKVGSVLVSPDNRRISVGYNGMISGYPEDEKIWERPQKYLHVVHSETNAIINAKTDLQGWTLYVTIPCCADCAKYIAQAGIKRVVYAKEPNPESKLNYDLAFEILRKAGVKVERFVEKSGLPS